MIDTLVGESTPEDFENDYRRDLRAMLDAKLSGEKITRPEPVAETPVIDLMEALAQRRRGADGQEAESRPEEAARGRKRLLRSAS